MERKNLVLLPDTIYIKKMKKNQNIVTMSEEYNIYFKNILLPYDDRWDIQVKCKYGQNLGDCWRLSNYLEKDDEFDFEIVVYNEYGEKLCSKKSRIVMVERKENVRTKVMFIGDSMTYSQKYINHIFETLRGIETVGMRSLNGNIQQEGRGGWAFEQYFNSWFEEFGLSPFLFPKGIEGKNYFGNKDFADNAADINAVTYQYYGLNYGEMAEGQYYTKDKKLYRKNNGDEELISENPEFEFDFGKYLERFSVEKPEIVSILMGANDLQNCPYEKSAERIGKYINYAKRMIEEIHKTDKDIKVIVNMPVLGAEQYCWGTQLGCSGSEKMYRFNIMHACDELINNFDNRQKENIYLSPMIACVDPVNGFPYEYVKANKYTEETVKKQSNWVHPNFTGYCQMGDALAAVIEEIRNI
ncbi:MAG: SGNH/GDSL hydrolase family protein [Clostridia bacterium]|nr:SGNH/GDSL hydrolase family protein [Clostridia bacterium]